MAQLKSDGVLVARRGAGSYILQTPAGTVFRLPSEGGRKPDLAQLFEMRLWIETQAATSAAQRRSTSDLKRMSDAIREMQKKRNDFNSAAAADVAFHRAIAAATNRSRMYPGKRIRQRCAHRMLRHLNRCHRRVRCR